MNVLFTEICIQILGIIGTICSDDPNVFQPSNDCWKFDSETLVCHVEEMTDLEIRASYYNPELCVDYIWNTNCYYDSEGKSTGDTLGDGTPTETAFGWAMACPAGMKNYILDVEYAGQWECRDSGSAIHPNFGKIYDPNEYGAYRYKWYITIDFLLREARDWNYMSLSWKVLYKPIDNTIYKKPSFQYIKY